MGHTHKSFDTDGSLAADTSVTAGTTVVAGTSVTAGTDVIATVRVTGAAIYGPTVSEITHPGFEVDGNSPPKFSYIRMYDQGYNAWANMRLYHGRLCV